MLLVKEETVTAVTCSSLGGGLLKHKGENIVGVGSASGPHESI